MKDFFRYVKEDIVNKDYARLLCFASIILYVLSLTMHTGIGGYSRREDWLGYGCLLFGWLSFMDTSYFILWISNLIFIYTVYKLCKKKISKRTLVLIFISFLSTIIYIFYHRYGWEQEFRNYACYIWSLSYMLALWASVLEWVKGEIPASGRKWINVLFTVFGIGILGLFSSELKYYHDLYGKSIHPDIEEYRINNKGVFYTSDGSLVQECLINYLEGANADSMVVLNKQYAKDNKHVWHYYDIVKDVDVATFTVSKTGVPKDKDHVYLQSYSSYSRLIPVSHYIDVATAEYFIHIIQPDNNSLSDYDEDWIRDSRHVFLEGFILRGIDVETFKRISYNEYQDKNGSYKSRDLYELGDIYKLRVKREKEVEIDE